MRISSNGNAFRAAGEGRSRVWMMPRCRQTYPTSATLDWAQRALVGTRSYRCQGLWLRAESREDLGYISRGRPAVAGRQRSLCGVGAFVCGSRRVAAGPDAWSHGEDDAEPAPGAGPARRDPRDALPGLEGSARPSLGISQGPGAHVSPYRTMGCRA